MVTSYEQFLYDRKANSIYAAYRVYLNAATDPRKAFALLADKYNLDEKTVKEYIQHYRTNNGSHASFGKDIRNYVTARRKKCGDLYFKARDNGQTHQQACRDICNTLDISAEILHADLNVYCKLRGIKRDHTGRIINTQEGGDK